MNGIYQCYSCNELVYSFGQPEGNGCTAENRDEHFWIKMGDQGENVYQCTFCAAILQARYIYQNAPCNSDPRKMHYWNKLGTLGDKQYLCKHCNAYVYLNSKPSNKNCPHAEKHEWGSLGKIGNKHYRCHYCKFEVYAASEPSRQSCSISSYHHWVQLNVVDTQTVINCFPVYCGLTFSVGNGYFYFNPGIRKHLPKPEFVHPKKPPVKKIPIKVVPFKPETPDRKVVNPPKKQVPVNVRRPNIRKAPPVPVKGKESPDKTPLIRVERFNPKPPALENKQPENKQIRLIGAGDVYNGLRPFDGPSQQNTASPEQEHIIMVPENSSGLDR
jgi:hypothetical protein